MSPKLAASGTGRYTGPARPRVHRLRRRVVLWLPFLLTLVVVSSVLAWGWTTRSSASPAGGGGTPPNLGPDPNPQHDRVVAVYASITYTGAQKDYLEIVETGNLCPECPVVVPANPAFSPQVAQLTFYFNVTNVDTAYHSFGNFSVSSTVPSGPSAFHLYGAFCCFPAYNEESEQIGLTPGQTFGLVVYAQADSLAGPAEVDYTLQFSASTSS